MKYPAIVKELVGISVSSGIAIGKAFLHLEMDIPEISRYKIGESQIEAELERLRAAFTKAADEVRGLHEHAVREMGKDSADIFTSHLMMLEDDDFKDQITGGIKETRENAEWVVYDTARILAQKMTASPDPVFRERAVDINDVSRRVLNHLL